MKVLDLEAVQTFVLLASLENFTRTAEATGTTQSAVSLKLKRLESFLGRKLLARTPRSVRLTAHGEAFLQRANELLAANQRALSAVVSPSYRLRLGVSDHVAGPELPALLAQLNTADPALTLEVRIGLSRELLELFDKGELDGAVVRHERGHRGGEVLIQDEYGWFAAPRFQRTENEPLRLANLAPPCGVRAMAIHALDSARIRWTEVFVGGGVAAVAAAVGAGLATAALARRIAPSGCIDVGAKLGLPRLPHTRIVLYSRVGDPRRRVAFRVISAVFRGTAQAGVLPGASERLLT
jgi:DNA-binding transcriptional LysR family regulator